MDFALTEEQVVLQRVAGEVFAGLAEASDPRTDLDARIASADLSAELAEVDFLGLLVPAFLDGSGASVLDLAVVAEEAGRHLLADPIVNGVGQAATLLRPFADTSSIAADLLTRLTKGTVALSVLDLRDAVLEGDRITGTAAPALHAASATTFLVTARRSDGQLVLGAVHPGSGVGVELREALDPTRGLATVVLDGAPVTVIAMGDEAAAAWAAAETVAWTLLAAQDLGTISQAVRLGVAYAKDREAFGRPIGSYQGVKHQLVDVYVLEEQLRSLVWLAAWSTEAQPENAALFARSAAAYAADAVVLAAKTLIHVHGGIGFTWEHPAHLFWRRAMTDRLVLGSAADHRDAVAVTLLAGDVRVP
jgi:alkylation response protein AidB-like acyl-CoA dehydrogenase